MNDTEAIKLALAGQHSGYKAIYVNHADFLYTHAFRILKNVESAEDAVQETFTAAWKSLGEFKGNSLLRTWLYRILYNNALKLIKKNRKKTILDTKPFTEANQSKIVDKIDVEKILDRLPEKDRALLIMRYWDELPIAACAEVLGMSPGNAKICLFRARKRFAQLYGPLKETQCHEM